MTMELQMDENGLPWGAAVIPEWWAELTPHHILDLAAEEGAALPSQQPVGGEGVYALAQFTPRQGGVDANFLSPNGTTRWFINEQGMMYTSSDPERLFSPSKMAEMGEIPDELESTFVPGWEHHIGAPPPPHLTSSIMQSNARSPPPGIDNSVYARTEANQWQRPDWMNKKLAKSDDSEIFYRHGIPVKSSRAARPTVDSPVPVPTTSPTIPEWKQRQEEFARKKAAAAQQQQQAQFNASQDLVADAAELSERTEGVTSPVPAVGSPVLGSPVLGSPVVGSPALGSPVVGAPTPSSPMVGSPIPSPPKPLRSSPAYHNPNSVQKGGEVNPPSWMKPSDEDAAKEDDGVPAWKKKLQQEQAAKQAAAASNKPKSFTSAFGTGKKAADTTASSANVPAWKKKLQEEAHSSASSPTPPARQQQQKAAASSPPPTQLTWKQRQDEERKRKEALLIQQQQQEEERLQREQEQAAQRQAAAAEEKEARRKAAAEEEGKEKARRWAQQEAEAARKKAAEEEEERRKRQQQEEEEEAKARKLEAQKKRELEAQKKRETMTAGGNNQEMDAQQLVLKLLALQDDAAKAKELRRTISPTVENNQTVAVPPAKLLEAIAHYARAFKLEGAGGGGAEKITNLRQVAIIGRLVIMKMYGSNSPELKQFEDGLRPAFS